ncbi:hypothetical protein CI109_106952 [Kwoniella shandongensis]|uniref:Uncharacterized protein n=1 Tax=Kwoniella shandongensis TaxID=1734106 RepID=A0A5M6C658_9TREE|nr:uncharacterized protein CI109_000794 [Kwoniella shandongensis]KAA5530614.1 hypothetical protein CI109_000794 [Kwoniella shandongensis]
MPLQARRPNLPSLCLPGKLTSMSLKEDVHTPMPYTPVPFEQGPLVMTPDTPSFELSPLDIVLSGSGVKRVFGEERSDKASDVDWSEDEDGLLQSYLAHPPRPLRTSYPPGTLPPPGALDEITTQIITVEARKPSIASTSDDLDEDDQGIASLRISSWRHSWNATRQRLFTIARRESMESIGGHRRLPSDSIVPTDLPLPGAAPQAVMKSQRPRLAVLGGSKMNRQQHSMDNLYGEEQPPAFSETLRLSSDLQCNATGDNSVLHSGSGLSSPLTFSFNFNPTKKPFPFSAPSSHLPRPASLLQRGRSFTSKDFAREHSFSKDVPDDFVLDGEGIDSGNESSHTHSPQKYRIKPEMQRSVSSPASTLRSSPTSSTSSRSQESEHEAELEIEVEAAPITPLNQTFGAALGLGMGMGEFLGSECSTPTVSSTPSVPPAMPSAPAITLTINSPDLGSSCSTDSTTPRLGSNGSPSNAFAALSLSHSTSLPSILPFTSTTSSATMSTSSSTGSLSSGTGAKRSLRPVPLCRSVSESSPMTAHLSPTRDRENKRQRALGVTAGPKFRPGLMVVVPKRLAGSGEELRSPFEIK